MDAEAVKKLVWAFSSYQFYINQLPWGGDAIEFGSLTKRQCLRLGKKASHLRFMQEATGVRVLPDLLLEHVVNQSFSNFHKDEKVVS